MEGITEFGSILRQTIGTASILWENGNVPTGVFLSEEANKLADETEAKLKALPADRNTSDGYHTFAELYDYRMAYNALLFNEWAKNGLHNVHRSWKHHDGEDCFAGGKHRWFVVVAQLPTGQISNHYKEQYWNLFSNVPVADMADEWDGHTPQQALERMLAYLSTDMKVDGGLMGPSNA